MSSSVTIAYLTSAYARASDTFIRGEVAQLRALGHTVRTFSVRRPALNEVVGEDVAREREATGYIVAAGPARLLWAGVRELLRSPRSLVDAAWLAARVGSPGMKGRAWPAAYLLEAAYLARKLRENRVEHLHNHIGEGSAVVAMLAAALVDIPFSLTVHGPNEFDRPTLLALDRKVGHAAFTVAISDYGRSQLYRWCHPEDWGKIHVVRCGVDATFLSSHKAPLPKVPRLLCVGRLAEQKGQLVLVDAAARLAAEGRDFEIVLVGDGPMRGQIERRVADAGLSGHVRLLGWRDEAGVRDELSRARAMVLPSFAEGLPVVLMEALAMGRPVISTYVAGIPELVEPGVNGWLVPPGSVEALARAMAEALDAPADLLERMGRAGAARVAERHDAAAEAAKLEALILGSRRGDLAGRAPGPEGGAASSVESTPVVSGPPDEGPVKIAWAWAARSGSVASNRYGPGHGG